MKNNNYENKFFQIRNYFKSSLIFFLCIIFNNVHAQEKTITGRVVDESGVPLAGVNIIIEGTQTGTLSDFDGNFTINAPSNSKLVFSYVGMKAQTVSIGNQTQLNTVMQEDLSALDEVVVVGYGTRKRSDMIASVTSVDPANMTKVATADVAEMLRGKAAGVRVTLGDGGPLGNSSIVIRGQNALNGELTGAYIIVDGVPAGSINDINPNDIESLEVLKDAAALAIYGSRGANGVVLITTRRGKLGITSINYNGATGLQTFNRAFDIYSGDEFAQLKREAFRTSNGGVYRPDSEIFSALELESVQTGNYIDWEKLILRTGTTHNHQISISSGTEKTKVYSSFNFFQNEGIIPNSAGTRVSGRFNIDQEVTKWLKVGVNTSLQYSREDGPNVGGILLTAISTSPLGRVFNDDGSLRFLPGDFSENRNPLIDLYETNTRDDSRNDIVNIFADLTLFKGLNYRINASRRSWNNKQRSYNSTNSVTGIIRGGIGSGFIYFQDNEEWQVENILTYKPEFKSDKHKLDITVLHSASEQKYTNFRNTSDQIPNDILGINGLETALINIPLIAESRSGLVSFAGRVEYGYDSRYYMLVSARADGSTRFGVNNKWGYFPAVGVSWNAHNESFLKNITAINQLKFSSSYGDIGNQTIGNGGTLTSGVQRDYILGGQQVSGLIPGDRLANPDLKWETTTTLNVKMDFGFLSNRINGTVEWYDSRTRDLLQSESLPTGLGYTNRLVNKGEIQNTGIEANLDLGIVRTNDLKVNLGFIFTKNTNKLLSLGGIDGDGDGREDDNVGNRWFIGKSLGGHFQRMGIGIFQQGEDIVNSAQPTAMPGDIKQLDVNGDGIINDDFDRVFTDGVEAWFGTVSLNMEYKGIDFSADVNIVEGRTRYNTFLVGYNEGGSLRGIKNGIKQNYWTPENPGGNFPRPSEANDPTNLFTIALQDASYIRLQNVTLGYSLPSQALDILGLNKLRFYVTGSNLITITDYQSFSPEKNPNEYPEAVTIVAGLQLSF
ncbi:SusC/RagA family TonB-linked outer membrane protein [Confluentibacter citreus]|uniref:SusC/RagA family TonB-linked outer membrane protein n=1 Tax=Confluentibacter citreus TaxID=2007307 RepID=UPI000C2858E0|nr:TonB-dependent receptor [Confluentibacter citreus]